MKREIRARTDREMLASFPIAGRLEGWFFRVTETSAGAYLAEGSDRWGRVTSARGSDAETALEQCVNDARRIAAETRAR